MKTKLARALAGVFLVSATCCLIVLPGGCAKRTPQGKGADKKNDRIRALAKFYGQYVQTNRGKTPPDEKAFQEFVQKTLPTTTDLPEEVAKVDLQTLFVSERDGKPFGILYGQAATTGPQTGPGGARVVIYEQEGAGGRRFVGSVLGAVDEVDQSRFEELVPKGG